MPDDDIVLRRIYQLKQEAERRRKQYSYEVGQQFHNELSLLLAASERDLDFDYKLRLTRALRKLRRNLRYDRKNYIR